MTPLRQRFHNDMVLRGLTQCTQLVYLDAVAKIAKFYHRSPDQISPDDIKQYLLHLINDKHLSTSTTNQARLCVAFLVSRDLASARCVLRSH